MTRNERRRLSLDVERPAPVTFTEPEDENEEPVQIIKSLPRGILRQMARFEEAQKREPGSATFDAQLAGMHRIRKVMRRRSHAAGRPNQRQIPWYLVVGAGYTGEKPVGIPDKAKAAKSGKAYKVMTFGLNELVWEDHPRRPGVKRLVSKAPKKNYEIIKLPKPKKVEPVGRLVYLHKEDVRDGEGNKEDVRDGEGNVTERIREWRPAVMRRW